MAFPALFGFTVFAYLRRLQTFLAKSVGWKGFGFVPDFFDVWAVEIFVRG